VGGVGGHRPDGCFRACLGVEGPVDGFRQQIGFAVVAVGGQALGAGTRGDGVGGVCHLGKGAHAQAEDDRGKYEKERQRGCDKR
jgi:hypothetical protein